jgi:aminoglycoside phosphotransferase (APT) family kinase protein
VNAEDLTKGLADFLRRHHNARSVTIEDLKLMTGGASRQTWSFDAIVTDQDGSARRVPLVLRSNPRRGSHTPQETEYYLLEAAHARGVPVPRVEGLGDGSLDMPFFLMERVDGETIPRRLLRDDAYASARETMAAQLGAILARIHSIPIDAPAFQSLSAPAPGESAAAHEIDRHEAFYRAVTPDPHPTFELAFRWLRARLLEPGANVLVHGDYRMGNFIVGPEGVRAVLDWELAHIGDPMEDLGWISVRSWRFGNDGLPAAGVGTRDQLIRAYEAAGGARVDAERVRFWEAFGNLRWGITCIVQARAYLDGHSANMELAAVGRRVAETEWELLNIMEAE